LQLNIDACEHTRLLRHAIKLVAVAYSEIERFTPYLKAAEDLKIRLLAVSKLLSIS